MDAYHRDQQLEELCNEVCDHMAESNQSTVKETEQIKLMVDDIEAQLNATDAVLVNDSDEDITIEERLPANMLKHLTVVPDDDEFLEEEDNVSFAIDTQRCKRYKSLNMIKEYAKVGLPLSFVVSMVNSKSYIGLVVGTGSNGYLVPLQIQEVVENGSMGFTYFHIQIDYDQFSLIHLYSPGEDGVPLMHHSVVNYGHLLPHLASLDQGDKSCEVPYAIVTIDANHMNDLYQFI
jgi:hypothetical protein